jgi:hypothetical protein
MEVVVNFSTGRFAPEEIGPGTHWMGDWVALKAGLDAMGNREKYCCCRESKSDSSDVAIPTEGVPLNVCFLQSTKCHVSAA